MPSIDAAEKLLRIALFSDSLQLTAADDRTDSLLKQREELARTLRVWRRKGVIEVFLSEALFVIALAISIYAAFGQIGSNETAIELGLGLFLAWLPIFVLSSISDRNPVAADEIRHQLNNLLDLVRTALLDPERKESYIKTIGKTEDDFAWTKFLEDEHYFPNAFFTQFAGQGRSRWHVRVVLGALAVIKSCLLVVSTDVHIRSFLAWKMLGLRIMEEAGWMTRTGRGRE